MVLPSRLSGLRHDAPYVFDGDGQRFVNAALRAAADGNPQWFGFPGSTYIYPLAFVYRLMYTVEGGTTFADYARHLADEPQSGFVPARVVSASASVLAIPATAALALALDVSPPAALGAAALVGLSRCHWALAHLVRSDMLLVLFATLASLFSVSAARGSARAAVLGGAAAGLAMASKWPGVLAWLPVLLGIALSPRDEAPLTPRRRAAAVLVLTLAGAALGAFASGWHYEWKELPGFESVPPEYRDGAEFLRRNLLALSALILASGAAALTVRSVARLAVRLGTDRRVWLSALALATAFCACGPFVLTGGESVVQGLVYEARSQSLTERGEPGWRNLVSYVTGPLAEDLGPLGLVAGVAGLALLALRREHLPAVAFPCLWLGYYAFTNIRSTRYVAVLIPPLAIGASHVVCRLLRRPGLVRALGVLALVALVGLPALEIARLQRESELPDTRALASDWFATNVPKGRTVAAEEHSVHLCSHCYRIISPGALYKMDRKPDLAITSSAVHDYFLRDPKRFASEIQRYSDVLASYARIVRFHPADGIAQGPEIVIYVRR